MKQEFTCWFTKSSPYYWEKHDLTILAERYEVYSGQRQYIVKEDVSKDLVLSKAKILNCKEPSYLEQMKGEQKCCQLVYYKAS